MGPATFGAADDELTLTGNRVTYHGTDSDFTDMWRGSTGRYAAYPTGGDAFSHTVADFPICC